VELGADYELLQFKNHTKYYLKLVTNLLNLIDAHSPTIENTTSIENTY
jgi:hypothetical protein